jgi:hypothetical protein
MDHNEYKTVYPSEGLLVHGDMDDYKCRGRQDLLFYLKSDQSLDLFPFLLILDHLSIFKKNKIDLTEVVTLGVHGLPQQKSNFDVAQ